ncbi:methyl-accepting chemotaxis protein [Halostagnicola kamekurae]|nr:methyl-accepting chemotaxis protein [Halostagnicola kamekurae]
MVDSVCEDIHTKHGGDGHVLERVRRRLHQQIDMRMVAGNDESESAEAINLRTDGGTTTSSAGTNQQSTELPISLEYAFDRLDTPVFTIGTDRSVKHWNSPLEELTGVPRSEAQSRAMASQSMYSDEREQKLLADKVLEAPDTAHERFDITRGESNGIPVYRDQTEFVAQGGNKRHISFSAVPLYRDEELVGVIELVDDRTADVRRTKEMQALVEELETTISALMDGNKGARADFTSEGNIDRSLLSVMDDLNALADQFEKLSTYAIANVGEIADAAEETSRKTEDITRMAAEQSESMNTIDDEIVSLSATVQEIASTAREIEEQGAQAEELATAGRASADEALEAMTEIDTVTTAVADDITELEERVDEIDEIVSVIDGIADQTNLLALNANIEAARNDGNNDGFVVIANEIKDLAEESKAYADEIETTVEQIQSVAAKSSRGITEASTAVDNGISEVTGVIERLEHIVDAVEETSQGVAEISDATDTQATSASEITDMVEQASAHADTVASNVREIEETTENQRDRVREIQETLEDHTL